MFIKHQFQFYTAIQIIFVDELHSVYEPLVLVVLEVFQTLVATLQ